MAPIKPEMCLTGSVSNQQAHLGGSRVSANVNAQANLGCFPPGLWQCVELLDTFVTKRLDAWIEYIEPHLSYIAPPEPLVFS
jgi:hypothetical protein